MILVLLEQEDGVTSPASMQAWAFAAELGDERHPVVGTGNPGSAAIGRALAACIERTGARLVVAAGTDRGNEVLAAAAAITGLPFVAECVAVAERDPLVLVRQRWGGSLLEEVQVDSAGMLAVAPHAVEPATDLLAEPEVLAIDATDALVPVRVEPIGEGGTSLEESRVVVGGGRGVGSAEGFATLEALAVALGGTIGVSRAVTSAGWRPHEQQIGQTGARIAPDVYVACGISGASQHLVGCARAKHVLAINTDPDAPIMARADHAVIGDLHAVVPAIVEEIRRRASA
jgi:electron transfer flavoprotein alpha subunit